MKLGSCVPTYFLAINVPIWTNVPMEITTVILNYLDARIHLVRLVATVLKVIKDLVESFCICTVLFGES